MPFPISAFISWLIAGALAGWAANDVEAEGGLSLPVNLLIGIIVAFAAGAAVILTRAEAGSGIGLSTIASFFGAVLLLALIIMVRRRSAS